MVPQSEAEDWSESLEKTVAVEEEEGHYSDPERTGDCIAALEEVVVGAVEKCSEETGVCIAVLEKAATMVAVVLVGEVGENYLEKTGDCIAALEERKVVVAAAVSCFERTGECTAALEMVVVVEAEYCSVRKGDYMAAALEWEAGEEEV